MANKSIVEPSRLCLYPFPTHTAALHIHSFAVCLINQGKYISQVRLRVMWFVWWEVEV